MLMNVWTVLLLLLVSLAVNAFSRFVPAAGLRLVMSLGAVAATLWCVWWFLDRYGWWQAALVFIASGFVYSALMSFGVRVAGVPASIEQEAELRRSRTGRPSDE